MGEDQTEAGATPEAKSAPDPVPSTDDTASKGKENGDRKRPAEAAASTEGTPKPPAKKRQRVSAKKANAKKPATKAPVTPKQKPAVSSESESSGSDDEEEEEEEAEAEASADTPTESAAIVLNQARRQLTDGVIDELVPLILKNKDQRVVLISSVNAQTVLSRFYHKKNINRDNVCTLLNVTRERLDAAECIAVVVHGPHTEDALSAHRIYSNTEKENYHWSLVAWFKSSPNKCFHYDSLPRTNDRRCREVVSVFRRLGVFPETTDKVSVPDFYPEQDEEWECGYNVLIALTIISEKTVAGPIRDDDVHQTYRPFFTTLARGGPQAPFVRRLRQLLAREQYA